MYVPILPPYRHSLARRFSPIRAGSGRCPGSRGRTPADPRPGLFHALAVARLRRIPCPPLRSGRIRRTSYRPPRWRSPPDQGSGGSRFCKGSRTSLQSRKVQNPAAGEEHCNGEMVRGRRRGTRVDSGRVLVCFRSGSRAAASRLLGRSSPRLGSGLSSRPTFRLDEHVSRELFRRIGAFLGRKGFFGLRA